MRRKIDAVITHRALARVSTQPRAAHSLAKAKEEPVVDPALLKAPSELGRWRDGMHSWSRTARFWRQGTTACTSPSVKPLVAALK